MPLERKPCNNGATRMHNDIFTTLAPTPNEHFKIYFYAAMAQVLEQVAESFDSLEAAFEQFPFLGGYQAELVHYGMENSQTLQSAEWQSALNDWEEGATAHLPLRALREVCGLNHSTMTLLFCIGLSEEDARLGLLFEALQCAANQHRPTLGLLSAWWRGDEGYGEARAGIKRLLELGLIQVVNPEAPRIEWACQPQAILWDVLRGEPLKEFSTWGRFREFDQCANLDDLILPETVKQQLTLIPQLLDSGEIRTVVIRGAHHNGRRTTLSALARGAGRGVLELRGLGKAEDERWRIIGTLATLLGALPLAVFDLAPGETAELPALSGYEGAIAVGLGKQGGVSGAGVQSAISLTLEMPDFTARKQHWQQALGISAADNLDDISERFRATSGNIYRAAKLATAYAALDGHSRVTLTDVQQALRALNRQALDTLAERVEVNGDWSHLATATATLSELFNLETLCRYREHLRESVSVMLSKQLNAGVRALFVGDSGTGKTLAAKLLAAILNKDLYRVDLSTVVNKYIGETEKNLSQIFARAEELDVILLLDEGDALLTSRTEVRSSNDRYANLETNYLLQRLESFEGILIVTTNAGERIDSAFRRRMDVVVEFRPPDASERWTIWQLHLPEHHTIESQLLREIASRCVLTGGQIRNVALHASLLALADGGLITNGHLEAAVQREYRKLGSVCPLRQSAGFNTRQIRLATP
jgi:hypothetical protein